MYIAIPEILFVLMFIALPLWVARTFPRSKRFGKFALPGALAVLAALLVINWATVFRPVN
jgi:hypothetical protein